MRTVRSLFVLLSLFFLPILAAHAQLSFTLSNPNQTGTAGATLTYEGTLTNLGSATLFLNGDIFSLAGTGLTLDDSAFFQQAPTSLSAFGTADASYTGALFTVEIAVDAPVQNGVGTFSIVGGADENAQNTLATQTFGTSVAPEPGTFTLLAVTGLLVCCRRRKRCQ